MLFDITSENFRSKNNNNQIAIVILLNTYLFYKIFKP